MQSKNIRGVRLTILRSLLVLAGGCGALLAQGNYEVQVYGSEMVPPGRTMVELHSNFTFQGSKTAIDGVRPDEHALHETLEITQGFKDWFEIGFYVFTSYRPSEGYQWVGDHIRPRVRAPESWHWPVGVSLSTELGYERRSYSPDTWTWGNPADRRQADRSLVFRFQPRTGALFSRAQRPPWCRLRAGLQSELRRLPRGLPRALNIMAISAKLRGSTRYTSNCRPSIRRST
ncbi:MAG: hypothetical protein WDO73_29445 [Ignavibacteriota bacterium]